MGAIRAIIGTAVCLIVGLFMLGKYFFTELPTLEKLDKVTGIVRFDTETRSTRREKTIYPVIILGGSSKNRFKYLDWFPNSGNITSLVREGEEATVWTDMKENQWVWQIEQGGRVVVDYSEIRAAVGSNKQFDLILGLCLIGVGVACAIFVAKQHSEDYSIS